MFVIFVCSILLQPLCSTASASSPPYDYLYHYHGYLHRPKSTVAPITKSRYGESGVVGFLVNQGEGMGIGPVHPSGEDNYQFRRSDTLILLQIINSNPTILASFFLWLLIVSQSGQYIAQRTKKKVS